MSPVEKYGSKKQAAEHGIGPGHVRDRDHDVPADRPVQVDARVERRDRLGIQHRPRAALLICTCSLRPWSSQSRKYSSRSCVWPSVRFTSTVKLVDEYQQAAMRPVPPASSRALRVGRGRGPGVASTGPRA